MTIPETTTVPCTHPEPKPESEAPLTLRECGEILMLGEEVRERWRQRRERWWRAP